MPVHSAHIGQEIEVHYRWHPLYGRRVKVRDIEQRGGGRVVHIEADPGVVRVVAEWMLDAAVCSAMAPGEPKVTVAALRTLHQLLADQRLRGNSQDGSNIVRRNAMGKVPNAVPAGLRSFQLIPRQMNMTFDTLELQGMNSAQRARAITYLASLLMQAAGVATPKEHNDDER
ncbi:hypothetical protein [Paraburkholderia sp. BL6665CI2N2]|uniref:hypothetical protein n=1 Tax=Paraburkholderia sp. BL6665CI2N2 TaxID=1938806 RepID=UPI001FBB1D83|nr:hypothetical protein [Paraburkholderia sp. BL6665CI2N2]